MHEVAGVRRALEIAHQRGEVGLQVAAYLGDELVVDMWSGDADPEARRKVDGSTLFNVFSVTKAIVATALHVLGDRGLVDYEAPVAEYWPAFARNGKERTSIRDVLSHRAGIPWMPRGVTPELQADWGWMIAQIEEMTPEFEPGTTNCYHALIWGWIVGEIIRRVDPQNRPIEVFVRQEIFEPLGIDDIYLGLPPSEDARRAQLLGGGPPDGAPEIFMRGMPAPVFPCAPVYNEASSLRAVNPGAGSIGTARAYARFFALLAGHGTLGGVRLLSPQLVEEFLTPRKGTDDIDIYFRGPAQIGQYGYHLGGNDPAGPVIGEKTTILQHPGAGGSIGWAELDTRLAVSICHNVMHGGQAERDRHPFGPIAAAVRAHASDLLAEGRP